MQFSSCLPSPAFLVTICVFCHDSCGVCSFVHAVHVQHCPLQSMLLSVPLGTIMSRGFLGVHNVSARYASIPELHVHKCMSLSFPPLLNPNLAGVSSETLCPKTHCRSVVSCLFSSKHPEASNLPSTFLVCLSACLCACSCSFLPCASSMIVYFCATIRAHSYPAFSSCLPFCLDPLADFAAVRYSCAHSGCVVTQWTMLCAWETTRTARPLKCP